MWRSGALPLAGCRPGGLIARRQFSQRPVDSLGTSADSSGPIRLGMKFKKHRHGIANPIGIIRLLLTAIQCITAVEIML